MKRIVLALAAIFVLSYAPQANAAVLVHHGSRAWTVGGSGADFLSMNIMVNENDINHKLQALMDPYAYGAKCASLFIKQIQLHRVVNGVDNIVLVQDINTWYDDGNPNPSCTTADHSGLWYESCVNGYYYARFTIKVDFESYITGLIGLNSFQWFGDAGAGC